MAFKPTSAPKHSARNTEVISIWPSKADPDLAKDFKAAAKRAGLSRSDFGRQAIRYALEHMEK